MTDLAWGFVWGYFMGVVIQPVLHWLIWRDWRRKP